MGFTFMLHNFTKRTAKIPLHSFTTPVHVSLLCSTRLILGSSHFLRVFKTLVAFEGYLWCIIVVAASRGIIHLSHALGDAASMLVH
jgi:hypothetical protein